MKLQFILKLVSFFIVFIGIVLYYVYYVDMTIIDSVLFVVLTITTIGYGDEQPATVANRLFTTFLMIFGVLFIFTYIRDVVHTLGRALKRHILPSMQLPNSLAAVLLFSSVVLVLVLAVGVVFIHFNEGFSFVTSLYFVVYTATTVGYGGIRIINKSTKIFLVFYAIIAPIILAFTFDTIINIYNRIDKTRNMLCILQDKIKIKEIIFDLEIAALQAEARQQQCAKSNVTRLLYHPKKKVRTATVPIPQVSLPLSTLQLLGNNTNTGTSTINKTETKEFHHVDVDLELGADEKEVKEEKPRSPLHILSDEYNSSVYSNRASSSKQNTTSVKEASSKSNNCKSLPPAVSQYRRPQCQESELSLQSLQSQQQDVRSSTHYYEPYSPLWLPLSSLYQLASTSQIHSVSVNTYTKASLSAKNSGSGSSSRSTSTGRLLNRSPSAVQHNDTKKRRFNRNDTTLSDTDELNGIIRSSSSLSTLSSDRKQGPVYPSPDRSYTLHKHPPPPAATASAGMDDHMAATDIEEGISRGLRVTKHAYILSVLLRLKVINYEHDVHLWAKKFDSYDPEHTGEVYIDDIATTSAVL